MNLKKRTSVIPGAVISALAITVSLAAAQGTQHQQSSATSTASARTIRGVWRTVVTPRNCQTGKSFLLFKACSRSIKGGRCRNMASVPVRVRPFEVPATESGSANTAGTSIVRVHVLPLQRERRSARIAENCGYVGTRRKRRPVCLALGDRGPR